jgi:hypothetical protein
VLPIAADEIRLQADSAARAEDIRVVQKQNCVIGGFVHWRQSEHGDGLRTESVVHRAM